MALHRRMRDSPYASLWCTSAYMGAFAASTAKPTSLFSNQIVMVALLKRWLTKDERQVLSSRSSELVRVHHNERGDAKVTGKKGLKGSQRYTREYAESVMGAYDAWYSRHRPSMREVCAESSESDYDGCEADEWADAELEPLARMSLPARARAFQF